MAPMPRPHHCHFLEPVLALSSSPSCFAGFLAALLLAEVIGFHIIIQKISEHSDSAFYSLVHHGLASSGIEP